MSNKVIDSHYAFIDYPDSYLDAYDSEAKEKVCRVIDWLNKNKHPATWLCKLVGGKSRSLVVRLLNGRYTSLVNEHLDNILNAIEHADDKKLNSDIPFCDQISIVKIAFFACKVARRRKQFALLTANVGTGKTRALMEYSNNNINTIFINGLPNMSALYFLDEIIRICKIHVVGIRKNYETKLKSILNYLDGGDYLIIVDEAETVSDKLLHTCRRIRDLSQTGIVLAGTPSLENLITPEGGTFDQIRSRVTFYSGQIRSINEEDTQAIIAAAFPQQTISKEIFKTFQHYARGSMRILVEQIIPNVKEIGMKETNELTADMIHNICKTILRLK